MIGISLDIPEVACRGSGTWLPSLGGTSPSLFADFTTEGKGNHYYFSGTNYTGAAAWMTAVGATFTRASSATYVQGGVVKTAGSNTLRLPTDISGNPLGARFTMAAQTELCLQNRDLTNVAWTATTATVAKDQTGVDGTATAASSILATAGNATVLQAITSGSAARIMGAYVKRLVGTGVINITQDNGATWTPIVPTASWTFFTLPSATLANPTVGFQIVTNGDQIAVDFVSERLGTAIYDAIATTTVTVTQAADVFKITPITPWFNSSSGTLAASFIAEATGSAAILSLNASGVYGNGSGFVVALAASSNFYFAGGFASSANFTGSGSSPERAAGIYDVPTTLQRVVGDGSNGENLTLDFTATGTNQIQVGAETTGGQLPFAGNMRALAYYPSAGSVVQARATLALFP